jgi:hypothetical protein
MGCGNPGGTDRWPVSPHDQRHGIVLRTYDVSVDGQRFLMLKNPETPPQDATEQRIIVVQNFFEELKRRVPVN